jgi:uncharacterized LabA/DUF88 family protein
MKGIHRKGLKMNTTEIKSVHLLIDVKQLFALEEILNTIRHDYPTEWASRSYYEEMRQYLKTKVLEVL